MSENVIEFGPLTESVSDVVRETLRREGIHIAPIHINIAYIRHFNQDDAYELKDDISRSDIIVPENSGGSHTSLRTFQKIVDGSLLYSLFDAFKGPRKSAYWEGVNNSSYCEQKRVIHIDLLRGTRLEHDFREASLKRDELEFEVIQNITKASHAEAAARALERCRNYVVQDHKREDYMIARLVPELVMTLRVAKELHSPARIKPITVFIPIGALHTRLGTLLKAKGGVIRERVSDNGAEALKHHFNNRDKVQRLYHSNAPIPPEMGKKLIVAALAEYLVSWYRRPRTTTNTALHALFMRPIGYAKWILSEACWQDSERIYVELAALIGPNMQITDQKKFDAFLVDFALRYSAQIDIEQKKVRRFRPW